MKNEGQREWEEAGKTGLKFEMVYDHVDGSSQVLSWNYNGLLNRRINISMRLLTEWLNEMNLP